MAMAFPIFQVYTPFVSDLYYHPHDYDLKRDSCWDVNIFGDFPDVMQMIRKTRKSSIPASKTKGLLKGKIKMEKSSSKKKKPSKGKNTGDHGTDKFTSKKKSTASPAPNGTPELSIKEQVTNKLNKKIKLMNQKGFGLSPKPEKKPTKKESKAAANARKNKDTSEQNGLFGARYQRKNIQNRSKRKAKPLQPDSSTNRIQASMDWTSLEDKYIIELSDTFGTNWELIADSLNTLPFSRTRTRSPRQCSDRHKFLCTQSSSDSVDLPPGLRSSSASILTSDSIDVIPPPPEYIYGGADAPTSNEEDSSNPSLASTVAKDTPSLVVSLVNMLPAKKKLLLLRGSSSITSSNESTPTPTLVANDPSLAAASMQQQTQHQVRYPEEIQTDDKPSTHQQRGPAIRQSANVKQPVSRHPSISIRTSASNLPSQQEFTSASAAAAAAAAAVDSFGRSIHQSRMSSNVPVIGHGNRMGIDIFPARVAKADPPIYDNRPKEKKIDQSQMCDAHSTSIPTSPYTTTSASTTSAPASTMVLSQRGGTIQQTMTGKPAPRTTPTTAYYHARQVPARGSPYQHSQSQSQTHLLHQQLLQAQAQGVALSQTPSHPTNRAPSPSIPSHLSKSSSMPLTSSTPGIQSVGSNTSTAHSNVFSTQSQHTPSPLHSSQPSVSQQAGMQATSLKQPQSTPSSVHTHSRYSTSTSHSLSTSNLASAYSVTQHTSVAPSRTNSLRTTTAPPAQGLAKPSLSASAGTVHNKAAIPTPSSTTAPSRTSSTPQTMRANPYNLQMGMQKAQQVGSPSPGTPKPVPGVDPKQKSTPTSVSRPPPSTTSSHTQSRGK